MAHRQLYYTQCYRTTAEYQIMAVVKYNTQDTESWDFRTRNHADIESYNFWAETAIKENKKALSAAERLPYI